ncbi:single-stranded-DNA-specific exonuclease RecJ [Flexistipes sinusarabici DSM 4947]|uniref:Single-stranded-DNA-specific exonuclease RecJ n=1 Tax=Flexistipes sinusarabici (strain ATCC 49648 / DSM 4947 / MAS 10) TaxID=717231 RepID=F8E926_FLESM|nr:single-stranded-DNA-specific exonuclease RecJ [Flexistipes sinusarabici]AEI15228.1 single-stranded-DNA-specific exonuclease RecJ [Flexistipes sinusarabici DSM 4947]
MSIHPVIHKILTGRGVLNKQKFLQPSLKDLSDPLNIVPQGAGELVADTIRQNNKIYIYGDYDVDGVCSAALLVNFFKELGFENYQTLIPSRYENGYGLTPDTARQMAEDGADMVITVDCGITSVKEVEYLKNHNLKVIVTDHHLPKYGQPEADFIINPKINPKKRNEPDYSLCGCGVVFKLLQIIRRILNRKDINLKKYLDLVGMATVADIVPLTGDNRILVKYGLDVINSTPSPGIKALVEISKLKDKKIKSYHHGFVLGPRINASGRMDIADTALKLLTGDDYAKNLKLAEELDNKNKDRQDLCEITFNEAVNITERDKYGKNRVIVVYQPHWVKGIIGIVASRIMEKYYRPVIIFGGEDRLQEGVTGSARSIDGIDMFEILSKIDRDSPGLLKKFGGHAKAAGLSVTRENIDKFRNKINEIVCSECKEEVFIKKNDYDLDITVDDIDVNLAKALELLEPFGEGNRKPLFRIKNPVIENQRIIGKNGEHLMFELGNVNGKKVRGIQFNTAKSEINPEQLFGYVECNRYNGGEYCQVKIIS